MATVLNSLYPPTIQSSMPTFPYTQDVDLYFSVSSYINVKDISYIHVSIVSQKTNRSVFQAKTPYGKWCYPTLLIVKMPSTPVNKNNRTYKITIPKEIIKSVVSTNQTREESVTKTSDESAITGGWEYDTFYKVQLRFDMGGVDENNQTIYDTANDRFYDWVFTNTDTGIVNVDLTKNQYYLNHNQEKFSEWSTVCLLRPIPNCGLFYQSGDSTKVSEWQSGIKGFKSDLDDSMITIEDYPNFSPGEILISTKLMFYAGDKAVSTSEKLASYTIEVYDESNSTKLLETETLYPIDMIEDTRREIWTYLDISPLESGLTYRIYNLKINYITTNGYSSSLTQSFVVSQELAPTAFKITPTIDNQNGIIKLRILQDDVDPSSGHPKIYSDGTSSELFPGYLHVKRASSKTKFKTWETMRVYSMGIEEGEDAFIDFTFEDNTIESRTGYIYSAQYENIENSLYPIRRTDDVDSYGDVLMADFDGPILTDNDNQIRLEMDYEVSSVALNVNRSKIETLGSVYPKFAENGIYNYKSFSISGKISAQLDDGSLYTTTQKEIFELEQQYYALPEEEQNYYVNFEKYLKAKEPNYLTFINKQQILGTQFLNYYYSKDGDGCYSKWGNWLEANDWMWEREFREQLIAWLNDGRPKLYRSLPEGNLAVILTDVQLQPVQELGRRIYDFSATMYEVGDGNSIENLNKLNIYKVIDAASVSYGDNPLATSGQKIQHLQRLTSFTLTPSVSASSDEKSYEIVKYIKDKVNYRYAKDEKNVMASYFINEEEPFYLRSVKLQFLNPPHLLKKEEPSDFYGLSIPRPIDPAAKDFNESDLTDSFYGYYIIVKFLNDTDNNAIPKYKGFYVNANGYMQFPDNIKVQELYFPHMNDTGEFADLGNDGKKETVNVDVIDMQFLACYKLSSTNEVVTGINYSSFIVSQISDTFQPNQSISYSLFKKYYSEKRNAGGELESKRYLDHWKGLTVTARPHTLFNFTYGGEGGEETKTYETGLTGTLNLNYYFPCADMSFAGIKFYHTDDPKYMSEFEYHRDSTNIYRTLNDITEPQNQWVYYISGDGWYIYWNKGFYRFIEGSNNATLEINDFVIDKQDPDKTYLYWVENEEDQKYYNLPVIGEGNTTTGLYYLWYDNEWFEVSSIYDMLESSLEDVGIGLIPVDATITYSGAIMKYNY